MTSTIDRNALRLAAALLLGGTTLSLIAGGFHPDHQPANNHAAAFLEYARSSAWTAIHLGQFAGMLLIVAGLIALFAAVDRPGWAGRLGAAWAMVSLGLYGVLQAVDGVALKQAVDAWASAPEAEKAARFASAEAIRWLEWGVRSYQSFVLGLSLLFFAFMVERAPGVAKPIAYLMALSGVAYLAQGWVLGSEGFSEANALPTLAGIVSVLAWALWLTIDALRMKRP